MSTDQKSSSEILNELFSTFNSSYKSSKPPKKSKKETKKKKKKRASSAESDVDSRLKKSRKAAEVALLLKKDKKKTSKRVGSSSVQPGKKKKVKVFKSKVEEDNSSVPIGDGFVVLKKSKVKEVEDGEIVDEVVEKKRKKEHDVFDNNKIHKSKKLSASQAYRLDAEEKLLLGYEDHGGGGGSRASSSSLYKRGRSSSPSSKPAKHKSSASSSTMTNYTSEMKSPISSSSSSSTRHSREQYSDRSRSPKPRLAPPRDLYRSSYLKFQKQRDYEDYHSSNSRSYDTASYYDYHAERSRENFDTSGRSGFGYVGKSYYYDDVEKERDKDSSRGDRYGTSAWRHRNRSRSRSPPRRSYYHPDDIIDKTQLLEIARKNTKKLMRSGVLPSDIFSRDQILAIKAGGKSVDELTRYCKKLARRDACGDATDARSDSDSDGGGGGDGHFIHHPFQVKDKPLPTITLNIRNAVPLPVRTPQALAIESAKLRTQFPVSSGTQHRTHEIEWKPVVEDGEKKESSSDPNAKALVPITDDNKSASSSVPAIVPAEEEDESVRSSSSSEIKAIEAPPPPPQQQESSSVGISVDGPDLPAVDIGSVIGLRLKAMRMLQENPRDGDAKSQLDEATQMMKHWADAKALEPKFLSPAELSSGPQAWAKRDQLRKTRALDSGMGMHLLQKMGWRPGEGLGKNKEGQLEPLALDVKTDKKGLTSAVEELMYGGKSKGGSNGGPSMPVVYDLSGKHPVSALMELTAKRRWGAPEFELCFEHGPPHKRQFVYKVIVNGVEYQPCVAVGNKKQAKANAAAFCLQSLGLLSTECTLGPGELLQTVAPTTDQSSVPLPVPPPPPVNVQGQGGGGGGSLTEKFGAPTYLQTVPSSSAASPLIGPKDPSLLMPPPRAPPPLFGGGK